MIARRNLNRLTDIENKLVVTSGKMEVGKTRQRYEIKRYKLFYKRDWQQGYGYKTGNYSNYLVITFMEFNL